MKKGHFTVSTTAKMEFFDITSELERVIGRGEIKEGICHVYNPHTTAGLTINEGADPAVRGDIIAVLHKMVPRDHPYRHMEGNSPAHIMASLMGSAVSFFIEDGRPVLGTWQRVFFCEFDGPRTRKVLWRIS